MSILPGLGNIQANGNIPSHIFSLQCDSARYLDWLKTIKESHGSVELSSISLATSINEKGIYRIKAPVEGQKVRHCLKMIPKHVYFSSFPLISTKLTLNVLYAFDLFTSTAEPTLGSVK